MTATPHKLYFSLHQRLEAQPAQAFCTAVRAVAQEPSPGMQLPEGVDRDTAFLVAWLLFSHAQVLDPRYIALSPMFLMGIEAGEGTWGALFAEINALEAANPESVKALDYFSKLSGPALEEEICKSLSSSFGGEAQAEALANTMAERALDAVKAGRWNQVPIAGPDAEATRSALAQLGGDLAAQVFQAWMAADSASVKEDWAEALQSLGHAAQMGPNVFATFVRRARVYFASGDRFKGGADLERALAIHPASAEAHAMRAELRAIIKDMKGSMEDWDMAIVVAPKQLAYRIGRGYTRLALGDLEGALSDLDVAVEVRGEDPTPLYNRADLHVRRKAYDLALDDYTEILKDYPKDPQVLVNRGTVFLLKKDTEPAIADFGAALESKADAPTTWAKRGAAQLTHGRPWPALLDAMAALALADAEWSHVAQIEHIAHSAHQQLDGSTPERTYNPADLEPQVYGIRRANQPAALPRFADLLQRFLPAEDIAFHLTRLRIYSEFGKWQEAMASAKDVLAIEEGHPEAIFLLAKATLSTGDPKGALSLLDPIDLSALSKAQQFGALLLQGRAYGTLQQFEEAIKAFASAAAVDPSRADVFFYLGVHLDLAGQKEKALDAYTRSIELDPQFPAAWFNRACENALLGHRDAALSDLEQAIKMEAKWAEAAAKDAYFRSLHGDPEFQALVSTTA